MVDLIKSMIIRAKQTLNHAYAPYSHYKVASCVCAEDGSLYVGVNVENASYSLSICAETAAICQMIADGKQTIKSLVLMNSENTLCTPCGACRQRIMEFATPTTMIHLCNQQTLIKSITIHDLLPDAFQLKS